MQFHFGRWLKREIQNTGLSCFQFAAIHGFSIDTLRRWIKLPSPALQGHKVAKLARALNLSREQIEAKLAEARTTEIHPEVVGTDKATGEAATAGAAA
ncbi:MAG: hypothetical protein ACM359_16010 [Bacillota bacterium]